MGRQRAGSRQAGNPRFCVQLSENSELRPPVPSRRSPRHPPPWSAAPAAPPPVPAAPGTVRPACPVPAPAPPTAAAPAAPAPRSRQRACSRGGGWLGGAGRLRRRRRRPATQWESPSPGFHCLSPLGTLFLLALLLALLSSPFLLGRGPLLLAGHREWVFCCRIGEICGCNCQQVPMRSCGTPTGRHQRSSGCCARCGVGQGVAQPPAAPIVIECLV